MKMTKEFTYFKRTGIIYDRDGEYDGDEGYNFSFEPLQEDFSNALVSIVTDYYFKDTIKKNPDMREELESRVRELIEDYDFEDALADAFEEELKEWFEDEAQESEGDYYD
jgi:hypothetical protein